MTPSTPSGRRLVQKATSDGTGERWYVVTGHAATDHPLSRDDLTAAILEVEREAVEAYRLALRAEIAAIRPPDRFVALDGTWEQGLSEASVLRLIEGEKP